MSFARYKNYRDSGVELLGEVPSHWRVAKVKDLAEIINGFPFDSTFFNSSSGKPLLRIRDLDGEETEIRTNEAYPPQVDVTGRDVLIGMDGDFNVGRWRGTENALLNQRVCALRADTAVLSRLLECNLSSHLKLINDLTFSTTVKHLSSSQIGAIRLAIPVAKPELLALVEFLDREMAKIDAMVEEQRQLIALLKEKRRAVISHAVTKGLDPTAPLGPAGVEWLGKIPAHWTMRKLKSITRLETGHTPSRQHPEYWVEDECVIPWFTLADVGTIRDGVTMKVVSTSQCISPVGMENSAARLLPADTVILSRTASVGFSAVLSTPMAVSQDFAAWICGPELVPDYLLLYLRAMQPEFRGLMMGSTHQTIYMPDIEAVKVLVPPIVEQRAIVKEAFAHKAGCERLMVEAEAAIALLQERRAALISAAVTGKIDVRGWTADDVRDAVSAEIIHFHARDRAFGRVENQKLHFLAHAYAGIHEIGGRFQRQAAGPHDAALISAVERSLTEKGVIQVSQQGGVGSQVTYTVSKNTRPDREQLKAMLGDRLGRLDHLLTTLDGLGKHGVEAIATLFGVWNDAILDGEMPDNDRLVRGFLNEWHAEKPLKFKEAEVGNWIGFMRRNGLVPEGLGPHTTSGTLL